MAFRCALLRGLQAVLAVLLVCQGETTVACAAKACAFEFFGNSVAPEAQGPGITEQLVSFSDKVPEGQGRPHGWLT